MLESKVKKIIEAPLESLGYGVVQIRFIESLKPKLEILIERIDSLPITVDDCARASRTISTHLDVEDIISKAYMLEVSSAGIDRPLVEYKDYVRFKGYKVFIQVAEPIFGFKKFRGFLEEVSSRQISIRSEAPNIEELVQIPFMDILKGKLDLDYMIALRLKERKEQNEA